MTSPLDLSLISGPVPVAATVAGVAALVCLGVGVRRFRVVSIAVVACAGLAAAVGFVVNVVWRPFPEPLPTSVPTGLGAVSLAVVLVVAQWRRAQWRARSLSVFAVALVLLSGLSWVNGHYGQYPNVRAALGPLVADTVDLDLAARPASTEVAVPEGKVLADVWQPPVGPPAKGTVSEAPIPSSTDYRPRPAWVYLPPAYAATPRPRLPVLVLLAGQPGTPRDWLDAGQLVQRLDAFAARHRGLAPIVVMPDQLGSMLANPACLDSRNGKVETYLARDVPRWIRKRLQVDERRTAWTIAGFSQGGTCALQLAVRAPDVYAAFIDISGQGEPTLGSRADTVRELFGGDAGAFRRVNPVDIMATTRFPATAGVVVAGQQDPYYRDADRKVFEACQRAGMDVRWVELPGGHDWNVWRPGLYDSLPWLAGRTGLAR
ncbi:enterochelin esterase-like enzyme [Saccharothrix tamanrassetensis]|uniref:Enterochelin esterase-like enzyme n=1 Tax=Saccharothrix tamanrassetensis TaxID=1051531 RepID=A0A841CVR6_9PSEU|nr:alpha/beta hydrolase-fold protein [Saccharothrix tamanrassetensis]MBB5960117.1 enterochelin esterase-like enzyme [Saccharothrix tamanrassetensis]